MSYPALSGDLFIPCKQSSVLSLLIRHRRSLPNFNAPGGSLIAVGLYGGYAYTESVRRLRTTYIVGAGASPGYWVKHDVGSCIYCSNDLAEADRIPHRLFVRNSDVYLEDREMAPLSFNDRINVSASVGTWLGSLFTAIGLIAVLSQLRAILVSNRTRQERFISRAAGLWTSCFNRQALQAEGAVEQAAPALAGWIQAQYLKNGTTKIMQSDTRLGGTSSWSKLFAQCSISPKELMKYGGPDALMLPTAASLATERTPTQADLRIEDGKMEYGFSATEFAALLIVAGLSSDAFTAKGTSSSVGYVGIMHLADFGPFSQIAHFDSHAGTRIMGDELTRLVHEVPVQGAIHLALGILKLAPNREHRRWIVLPSHLESFESDSDFGAIDMRRWKQLPRSSQLNNIRYNIEQLAVVSGGDMITYSSQSPAMMELEERVMQEMLQSSGIITASGYFQEAMLSAYAIDALQPWALLPVAPQHFVDGFADILSMFVVSRKDSLGELSTRLRQTPPEGPLDSPKSGWKNVQEQIDALNCIGDIRTEYFCRSSNYCAYYFRAMTKVFHHARLPLQTVRRRLAAEVAYNILTSAPAYPTMGDSSGEKEHRANFVSALTNHLSEPPLLQHTRAQKAHSQDPFDVENWDLEESIWAIKIYATYLWGWLHDRQETDGNFVGKFRRRIFLG